MDRAAILITGGARRIGAMLAREFGSVGWHVVIHHGKSRDAAQAMAASLPSAEAVECDLSDPLAMGEMVQALAARLPDWRALINCAAVFRHDDGTALDPAVFGEAMAVNARAPVLLAQAFLAQAQAAGGRRVINLLDMKIANLNPDFFSYTMAKSALSAATRMLAMAHVADGDGADSLAADRIYGLAPGAMLASFDQAPDEHLKSGRMNLLHRLTDPRELVAAARFLAGGWLASGEIMFVDSGQHLLSQPRDVLYLARG